MCPSSKVEATPTAPLRQTFWLAEWSHNQQWVTLLSKIAYEAAPASKNDKKGKNKQDNTTEGEDE
jgi:hypothetical protein